MNILGIETSCDETAAAVVADGKTILSSVVASQDDLHRPFGGVVPEVASRAHCERITAVVEEALRRASLGPENIGAVAVVSGPGLIGALLVGLSSAKSLALAWGKPLVAVDHLHAHAYAPVLAGFDELPHVALVVSGGHTVLYNVRDRLRPELIGATVDDAAGECFDKVAQMLSLGYPGGPAIAAAASGGNPRALSFPLPLISRETLDFSFSGLKTAVYYRLRRTSVGRGPLPPISDSERRDVAASFQEAACRGLADRAIEACRRTGVSALAVGGGVACNRRLREILAEGCQGAGIRVFFPPAQLCTDNAAMVAGLAALALERGLTSDLHLDADPTPLRSR
ncbi:MAG: tRNA (adenosine(37)-N6)-threonylcarbamoyltransferase complex transferase subunit TsaD [Planctomycetota bacterium]|nr:tRNA (adenosine(37)-N6)-threonylcarbamoyltransferase complex transferase subunit TsaD [Planctomycetota bacterium]